MASTFDVEQFISSGGKGVAKDVASIRAAAEAIVSKGKNFYQQQYGNSRIYDLARQSVLPFLNEADAGVTDFHDQNYINNLVNKAYNTLTLAKDTVSFKKLNLNYENKKKEITTKIAQNSEWLANRLDFSGWNLNDPAQKAQADSITNSDATKQKQTELDSYMKSAEQFGIDTTSAQKTTKTGGYLVSDVLKAKEPVIGESLNPGKTTNTSAVTTAFKPTEYSVTNGLDTLQTNVMAADSNAAANKDFINGVFKAFHNRDATATELAAYEGKKVGDVRTEIIGGAQAAGLPTVKAGTVNIPTGTISPADALAKGYQKVLRPDQLSAFREDQIVRDANGGIWLNPDTTTQAQKDAVASGKNGSSIGTVAPPSVSGTAPAADLEGAASAPDPSTFLDFTGGSGDGGASANEQATAVTDYASTYIDSILAGYDKILAGYQTKLDQANASLDTLTGKISKMTTDTPNADALAQSLKAEGVRTKQAQLSEIKTQIAQLQEQLQLGLINESNKMAPLSIIGSRQATLQSQGLAKIGALTAIAQVIQGDLDFAKTMVDATVSAMNADRTSQLSALGTLTDLAEKQIVQLSSEESDVLTARQNALSDAMDSAQKDADKTFDLIKANPGAALKGKVTLSDSAATALSKMAPYMAADAEKAATAKADTQVIDLGGKKVLINSKTGEIIQDYTETKAPGSGSAGEKYTDVTRADGSKVRVFLDSTGRPTGEEVTIVGADTTDTSAQDAEAAAARKDAADYVEKLGNKEVSWATAWNAMKAKYPNAANESIDAALNKDKYYKVE